MLHSGTVRWKGPRKKPPAPDLTPGPGLEITSIPDLAPELSFRIPAVPEHRIPPIFEVSDLEISPIPELSPESYHKNSPIPSHSGELHPHPPHPKKPSISFYSDFVVIPWLPVARVPFHLSRNAYWHSPAIPALRDLARNTTSSRLGHRGKPVSTVKAKNSLNKAGGGKRGEKETRWGETLIVVVLGKG